MTSTRVLHGVPVVTIDGRLRIAARPPVCHGYANGCACAGCVEREQDEPRFANSCAWSACAKCDETGAWCCASCCVCETEPDDARDECASAPRIRQPWEPRPPRRARA